MNKTTKPCACYEPAQEPEEPGTVCFNCGWLRKDHKAVKVIFRKWPKREGGDVIAIFPELLEDATGRYVLSYQHEGQHGACPLNIVWRTKLATPEEYAPLKKELEKQAGYTLKVIQRWPSHRRMEELRREYVAENGEYTLRP